VTSSAKFKAFIEDQLSDIRDLHIKRMFGGFGFYAGETFFAIIAQDRFYLWMAEDDPRAAGLAPFSPRAKYSMGHYLEIPPEILEDGDELLAWARQSISARRHLEAISERER
jgi:DNA transformation protein and related proteins